MIPEERARDVLVKYYEEGPLSQDFTAGGLGTLFTAAIYADRQECHREALAAAGVDLKYFEDVIKAHWNAATPTAKHLGEAIDMIDHLAALVLALSTERDVNLQSLARVKELEVALLGLTRTDWSNCWCPHYFSPTAGHHITCKQARKLLGIKEIDP